MTKPADREATRLFFSEVIEPFLMKNNLSVKEFARALKREPNTIAQWEHGIILVDAKDRKEVLKYIENYEKNPPEPPPVEKGILKKMDEVADLEKREKFVRTLPMWAIRGLLKKFAQAEKITQKDLLELIEATAGQKVCSLPSMSTILSGKTKQPNDRVIDALKKYVAQEDMYKRFGMPERPNLFPIECSVAPKSEELPPLAAPRQPERDEPVRKEGEHTIDTTLDDDEYIDIVASIGHNGALHYSRRHQLIKKLFKLEFKSLSHSPNSHDIA